MKNNQSHPDLWLLFKTYLRGMLVSLWSVQNGTSDIISHARHLGSTLCDPQHLIGCLVIQGKVDPVCGMWKICSQDSQKARGQKY